MIFVAWHCTVSNPTIYTAATQSHAQVPRTSVIALNEYAKRNAAVHWRWGNTYIPKIIDLASCKHYVMYNDVTLCAKKLWFINNYLGICMHVAFCSVESLQYLIPVTCLILLPIANYTLSRKNEEIAKLAKKFKDKIGWLNSCYNVV